MLGKLSRFCHLIHGDFDYPLLFECLVHGIQDVLHVEAASLLLLGKGKSVSRMFSVAQQNLVRQTAVPVHEGLVQELLRAREAFMIEDAVGDSRFSRVCDEYLPETRDLLVAPVFLEDVLFAVVDVRNAERDGFSMADLLLLRYCVDHFTSVLAERKVAESVHSLQELLLSRMYDVNLMHRFQCVIYSALCSEVLLKNAFYFVFEEFDFQAAVLYSRESCAESFRVVQNIAAQEDLFREKDFIRRLALQCRKAEYALLCVPCYLHSVGQNVSLLVFPVAAGTTLWGMLVFWKVGVDLQLRRVGRRLCRHLLSLLSQAYSDLLLQNLCVEKEAVDKEVAIVKLIQEKILPKRFDAVPVDIAAVSIPAHDVGGDFYDCIPLDAYRFAFVLGDVAGKGIRASLFMMLSQSAFRAEALYDASPKDLIQRVNSLLYADSVAGVFFVTAFYVVVDTLNSVLTYVSAGHDTQSFFRKSSQRVLSIKPQGKGLGILDTASYEEKVLFYHQGDMLLLYTDGVLEAENDSGEQFGQKRLQEFMREYHCLKPHRFLVALQKYVASFCGNRAFMDDFTVVAMRL